MAHRGLLLLLLLLLLLSLVYATSLSSSFYAPCQSTPSFLLHYTNIISVLLLLLVVLVSHVRGFERPWIQPFEALRPVN